MLALLAALALNAAPPSTPPALPQALEQLFRARSGPDLAAVQRRLRDAEAAAKTPADRALIHRLGDLVPTFADQLQRDPEAVLVTLDDVLADGVKLYPQDEAFQLQTLVLRLTFAERFTPDQPNSRYAREADQALRELPKQFPRSARVHYYRSVYGDRLGLSWLDRMREAKQCLDLDPSDASCRRALDAQIDAYRAPRCEHGQIATGLAMFAEDAAGKRQVKDYRGQPVPIGNAPLFSAADVAEVKLSSKDACSIALVPAARERFASATEKLIGRHAALMLEDRVLLVATVNERIPNGQLRYSAEKDGPSCDQLCTRVTTPELPPDLAPLAK